MSQILTRTFQDENGLWDVDEVNTVVAMTNNNLRNYISQLQNFNQSVSLSIFNSTKKAW